MPRLESRRGRAEVYSLFAFISCLLLPVAVLAQGNGRASTGTDGIHTIQGYIFYPSGRRAEGQIVVKLQNYNSGEITVIPDSSGAFTFTQLAPGNYTVVVNAGDDYEIARENVYFDSDINLSRVGGARVPQTPQRSTVMIHLQLKNSAHAKPGVVNAALAEVPERARKLFEKGVDEARAGDAAKAADSLRDAVALYPNFPLALNELGVQYLKLGQTGKAIEALKAAVKLNPDSYGARLNLGIALLEAKQFAEAVAQLQEALKRNASLPTAHMYLGLCFLRTNRYDEAEKELLSAIQGSNNQLGLAQYYLGGIYWKKHEYPKAIAALEDYLRLTPNARDAERVRATIKELRSRSTP
ncbi:MAG TPA: tetratricopeptide repeat protein [Pyrinomonadaceae bacterium]|nr:tetratricopeptide repeat protein [Pyrinomonadaceae bacterium]